MTYLEEYKPLVSIVMATHNRGDMITNAIKSVLNQTYRNWELIVVADGCTDNTNAIVSDFVKEDDRIIHLPVDKMEYYTHVRNHGLDNSSGELIAFRDDDGAWTEDFLEQSVIRHRNSSVAVTYCGRVLVNGVAFANVDITKLEELPGEKMEIVQFMGADSLTNKIDVGDIMIKRSVFHGEFVGFTVEKDRPGYCSDALLIDDIYRNNPNGQVVTIPRYMHYYFQNHGGKTENMTQRKLKHRNEFGDLGPDEAEWVF